MPTPTTNPLLKKSSILLAALSLSIGWGIRGNYGHEFGAMLPGALTAMAVCLLSGRRDWHERIAYFAFFGAVGWGFGGSFSYMQVIGYTHSGHFQSQVYGFYMLFVLGFFWAALGGAGTALPAVLDRKRLTELFKPFTFVLVVGAVLYFSLDYLTEKLKEIQNAEHRHEISIYWQDSDWIEVGAALLAVLAFDIWDRYSKGRALQVLLLPVFGLVGALLGAGAHVLLYRLNLTGMIGNLFVRYYGDLTVYQPEQLVANWPMFMVHSPQNIGWMIGLAIGIAVYFAFYGKFRCGSSLMLHMILGWFVCFIVFPVLLNVRLTPPRGDNWAGVMGLILGAYIYFWRNGLKQVIYASLICGLVGGIGFSGIACLKLLLVSIGNPNISTDLGFVEACRHWQSQNWHSFLEQSYGFVNGIGVAVALGFLAKVAGPVDNEAPRRRWTEGLAIFFALPVVAYVNMVKNLGDWTRDHGGFTSVPTMMTAPFIRSWEFSALTWFNLFAWSAMVAVVVLLYMHTRRPLNLLSMDWIGRGQLAYLLLLWVFAIGNATKAIVSFSDQRLLTEWVILMNAIICTLMIFLLPKSERRRSDEPNRYSVFRSSLIGWACVALVSVFLLLPAVETTVVRWIYGDAHAGHAGTDVRFGENATYKVKPLLKGVRHR